MKTVVLLLLILGLACNLAIAANYTEDFEKGQTGTPPEGWIVVDEPAALLNDKGPSNWVIANSPISGKALNQTTNIWGDNPDFVALGTFIIYDLQEFKDFDLTVEIFANDNDGMGIIWGWKDRTSHYRFFTMVDPGNPGGAQGGNHDPGKAPWSMIEKRIGDELPYYNTLKQVKDAAYAQGVQSTFQVSVKEGEFKVLANKKEIVSAKDAAYAGGKIGFTLYAESGIYFDNIQVKDTAAAVDPKSKLASTWGSLRIGL